MTILVSGLSSSGGAKKISSAGLGGTIATGTTANVTITCPANKYINLTLFGASGGNQAGVSISVGGRSIISSEIITQDQSVASVSTFKVGQFGSPISSSAGYNSHSILGGRSEDFVFSFDAATTRDLRYSYEVLEDA